MHTQPLAYQHGQAAAGKTRAAGTRRLSVPRAMPFQLPNSSELGRKVNPLQLISLPQQRAKPINQQRDVANQHSSIAAADTSPGSHVPLDNALQQARTAHLAAGGVQQLHPSGNSSLARSSIKFAKHLSNVSNGCAPPMSRFESLGWLLFESKRLQAALVCPNPAAVDNWLCSADTMQLLEQIYLVGAAIAELGTADGLQPLTSSNGSRAIMSLDYSRLLERYLQQHGHLLAEDFWGSLHAYDDLQARAIHVATALETRCMVHAMLFDKLIERVGTEGSSTSPFGSSWAAQGSAPLATAITNTMINTTQQHSAPVTTQSTVATPSAVNSNSGNTSNVANSSTTGGQAAVHGVWGWIGQLGAVFLLLCTVAGKVVTLVFAVVGLAKDLVMQLFMLKAVSASAKAVAAKASGSKGQLQPAYAAAGALPAAAAGALPAAAADAQQQLPSAMTQGIPAVLQSAVPVAGAVPAAMSTLGAASAAAVAAVSAGDVAMAADVSLPPQQQAVAAPVLEPQQSQQQQQQQWEAGAAAQRQRAGALHVQASPAAARDGPPQPQPQLRPPPPPPQQQQQAGSQGSKREMLLSGLRGGLGNARQVLSAAAAKATSGAAVVSSALQHRLDQQSRRQQQQQQGARSAPFRAGTGQLLYSLWSPSEAGLQDADLDGTGGVLFADAGWESGARGLGAVVQSAEEEGW